MTNLSAEALRELKEKAEKASSGPWAWDGCVWDYDEEQESPWLVQNHGSQSPVIEGALHAEQPDATYIAAASPDVLLALLAERERLLTLIRRHVEWTRHWYSDDELNAECLDILNEMRAALAAAGEE